MYIYIFIIISMIYIFFILFKKNIKYTKKEKILTNNELKFYKVLIEITNELNLQLLSQVAVYELIESNNYYAFNKISRKTIDFVIVDKKTTKILLAIELDDSTHKRKDRIKRDLFINNLFKKVGINLLRYPVYKTYYKDTLKKRIIENL